MVEDDESDGVVEEVESDSMVKNSESDGIEKTERYACQCLVVEEGRSCDKLSRGHLYILQPSLSNSIIFYCMLLFGRVMEYSCTAKMLMVNRQKEISNLYSYFAYMHVFNSCTNRLH